MWEKNQGARKLPRHPDYKKNPKEMYKWKKNWKKYKKVGPEISHVARKLPWIN